MGCCGKNGRATRRLRNKMSEQKNSKENTPYMIALKEKRKKLAEIAEIAEIAGKESKKAPVIQEAPDLPKVGE